MVPRRRLAILSVLSILLILHDWTPSYCGRRIQLMGEPWVSTCRQHSFVVVVGIKESCHCRSENSERSGERSHRITTSTTKAQPMQLNRFPSTTRLYINAERSNTSHWTTANTEPKRTRYPDRDPSPMRKTDLCLGIQIESNRSGALPISIPHPQSARQKKETH